MELDLTLIYYYLDVRDSKVVTSLAHSSLLAHEQQKSDLDHGKQRLEVMSDFVLHLVDNVRGEVELGLEGHAHVGRGLVGEEGGVASYPGGEAGLSNGKRALGHVISIGQWQASIYLMQSDALLADGAPPSMGTKAEEPITRLRLANESIRVR